MEGSYLKPEPLSNGQRDQSISLISQSELSYSQQRLWFLSRLEPDNPFYHLGLLLDLKGPIDYHALERALQKVVRRHEPLRTTFAISDGVPTQKVGSEDEAESIRLPCWNCYHEDVYIRLKDTIARLDELFAVPFDLETEWPVRGGIIQVDEEHHILAVIFHHIAFDGWSRGVLIRELSAFYEFFRLGSKEEPLSELRGHYSDFTQWQREQMEGKDLERLLGYWGKKLENLPELHLPTDYPRPAKVSYRGESCYFHLDANLTRRIDNLCENAGATRFMVLLAAFHIWLSRCSGQDDFGIGTPIANRQRPDDMDLIGFFVNSLVMRGELSQEENFLKFLKQVKETTLDAFDHHQLPFDLLVEHVSPKRYKDRNPLVQVVFGMQTAPPGEAVWGDKLTVAPCPQKVETVRFDLEFHAWPVPEAEGEALHCFWIFSRDLWKSETMGRWTQNFKTLLEGLIAEPSLPIREVPWINLEEEQQLLEFGQRRSHRPHKTISELFASTVAEHLHQPALCFGDDSWSYEVLSNRSAQIASRLTELGVRKGSVVAFYLPRGFEAIATIFGILQIGGVYLPLDRRLPNRRLSQMLESAGVEIIVTLTDWAGQLLVEDRNNRHLFIDDDDSLAQEAEDRLESTANGPVGLNIEQEDPAYIMFTSGSTGIPKAVVVPHEAVIRLAFGLEDFVSLGPDTRMLHLSNLGFDAATFEIFGALLHGGKVVIVGEDPPSLSELSRNVCENGEITTFLTSALFDEVVDRSPEILAACREVLVGGEQVSVDHMKRAMKLAPGTRLINVYGPTETTTFATAHTVTEASFEMCASVPIGKPIGNTSTFVLDENMRHVPMGIPGELYIGGSGLALGYSNDDELTRQRFVSANLGVGNRIRLYQTGDWVRWLPDGSLQFLGRKDKQIKLRGFRIELGEIEEALRGHEQVRDCAVRAWGNGSEKRIVAYVEEQPDFRESDGNQTEHVSHWKTIFDEEVYGDLNKGGENPGFNISGWRSAIDGTNFSTAEMREWLDDTISAVKHHNPSRILEIGCGTGMILFEIAPTCERYWATDYSSAVIEYVKKHQNRLDGHCPDFRLLKREAIDFSGMEKGAFDMVILNSIVQYFPDVDYLGQVLKGALRVLRPGGCLFLGDIRSHSLLETFHVAAELLRRNGSGEENLSQFEKSVRKNMAAETELMVAPEFFSSFARQTEGIEECRIFPKRGQFTNELNQFRYQVVLTTRKVDTRTVANWQNWKQDNYSLEKLRLQLESESCEMIALEDVPNARIADAVGSLAMGEQLEWSGNEMVSSLESRQDQVEHRNEISLSQLEDLAGEFGWRLNVSWARHEKDGALDVVFSRHEMPIEFRSKDSEGRPLTEMANQPSRSSRTSLHPEELSSFLSDELPEYMIPSTFTLLESLPLTINGKVNRDALPSPEKIEQQKRDDIVLPSNELEQRLAEIWMEILNLRQLGVHDSFFEIGGHSLLAVKLISVLEEEFDREIPVRVLFKRPTIAKLAELLEESAGDLFPEKRGEDFFDQLRESFPQPIWMKETDDESSALYLKEGTSDRPLFLFPGGFAGENELLVFAALVPHLNIDQTVIGFRAPLEKWSQQRGNVTVRGIAREYISQIKMIQPSGPYLIGGECIAGVVAYEIARQLVRKKEEVTRLILLDSVCPNRKRFKRSNFPVNDWIEASHGEEWAKLVTPYYKSLFSYEPKRYNGDVDLIVSDASDEALSMKLGWKRHIRGRCRVVSVAGDHDTYIRNFARETGKTLGGLLEDANRAIDLKR